MSVDFKQPTWAVAPPSTDSWTLLEIKGGIQVATYKLNKPCTLFGRASNDVSLAHESCSRLHARIAFDKNGIPWLRDLNSSHGTMVNKRKLPVAAIGKVESNSTKRGARGVILYPGDVVQFGASTRMYCLEGPPEYERGAIRKQPPTKNEASGNSLQATGLSASSNKEENAGISWGMDDTNDIQENHNADAHHASQQPLDSTMIPDKHRKLFERFTAKQYKLQNVQLESERIRNKGTELSQGQEAQLRKNDERIQLWEKEITELEQELRKKLYPKKNPASLSHSKRKARPQDEEEDEDDYDFYDRTKDAKEDLFEDGETQDSLTKKWKELLGEWKSCSSSLLTSRQKVDRLEKRLKAAADQNDEDAFFLQNDLSLAKDSLNKEEERKEEIAHNLQETERLLNVVNPRLQFSRETGSVGEPGEKPETPSATDELDDSAMMPPPVSASSPLAPRRTMSPAASMPPPPMAMPPPLKEMPPPAQATDDIMPPPKRARILGPAMPPPSTKKEISTLAVDEMEMPKRPLAPPIGTLSVLAAARKQEGQQTSPKSRKEPPHSPTKADYDPKKDVWKAPKDQDGSGFTKLNAKFAGRY